MSGNSGFVSKESLGLAEKRTQTISEVLASSASIKTPDGSPLSTVVEVLRCIRDAGHVLVDGKKETFGLSKEDAQKQ